MLRSWLLCTASPPDDSSCHGCLHAPAACSSVSTRTNRHSNTPAPPLQVRLVAHGMGARLVFHCLLELCRQGARGVVQHAVLMGCPVRRSVERQEPSQLASWLAGCDIDCCAVWPVKLQLTRTNRLLA